MEDLGQRHRLFWAVRHLGHSSIGTGQGGRLRAENLPVKAHGLVP